MPNLASFNRECGVLEQHPLVEHFGAMQKLDRGHIDAIHIATEGDDPTHTAFSHKLELAIQRWGGPEDNHEHKFPLLAELGGTTAVLDDHQVTYDERIHVKGYHVPEWAHATTREDLDVDRLQYIAAEALLWFDHDAADPAVRARVKDALDLGNFELTPDGQLAFTDADHALVVSKLLMLFSTEHWNDPINRAHLHLGIHGVQRNIMERRLAWMDEIDRGETRKPTNYFYGIDQDFTDALSTGPGHSDEFVYLISNILNESGMQERRRFVEYRLAEYTRFIMDDSAQNYPSEYLEPKRVEFGPRSSSMHTEVVELSDEQKTQLASVKVPQLEKGNDDLSYIAGPLKNRYIDPLVRQGNTYVRLSDAKPVYARLRAEQEYLQSLGVRVSFAFATHGYARQFRDGMKRNDAEFERLQQSASDMTHDQKRRIIEQAAQRSIKLCHQAGVVVLKGEAQRFLEEVR
ncbi:hypothetical protein E6P97_03660 [Patescibacteria group bacterium]|nr:MAG: hypothetical protein E6P97_03660 [Patescibacteria group bacterium]